MLPQLVHVVKMHNNSMTTKFSIIIIMRLDQYLTQQNTKFSRTYWQKSIKEGCISLNGEVTTIPRTAITEADQVEILRELPYRMLDESIKAENIPLDIVYEDDDIIVINKSEKMVVHPAIGNFSGTLVNALLHHTKTLSDNEHRPGIVHRLDKGTSGLMVVAKNDEAHFHLTKQFASRDIRREYIALIRGVPLKTKGTINAPILKDPKHFDRMKVDQYSEKAKEAVTHYEVVDILGNTKSTLNTRFCLVRCRLETGRTHQIRVHMKHLGHPVIGDKVYGYPIQSLSRQFLHAEKLTLIHPKTHMEMCFEAALPKDLQEFINAIKV